MLSRAEHEVVLLPGQVATEALEQVAKKFDLASGQPAEQALLHVIPRGVDALAPVTSCGGQVRARGARIIWVGPALDEPRALEAPQRLVDRGQLNAEPTGEVALAKSIRPAELGEEEFLPDMQPEGFQLCGHAATVRPGRLHQQVANARSDLRTRHGG